MKLEAMLGCKLFKELDDGTIDLIRIIKLRKNKDGEANKEKIKILNEGTKEESTVDINYINDYSPLEPDGVLTFNVISIKNPEKGKEDLHDVIVTASKFLNLKIGDTFPYAICRQSVTDIFYNLLCKDESDMMVGLAVNQETCPSNFDFRILLACDSIDFSQTINFYRTDMLSDILPMVKILPFDEVMYTLFAEHCNSESASVSAIVKKSDKGWCRDLNTLLEQNNFQTDIDQMLGITYITTDISNHIVSKKLPNDEDYDSLDKDMTDWLSYIFNLAIKDITILKYNHDINLAEFNNSRYFLLRDKNKDLYLVVYTLDGEYHQADLEAKFEHKDFSEEFRLNFYNKYNKNK